MGRGTKDVPSTLQNQDLINPQPSQTRTKENAKTENLNPETQTPRTEN